MVVNINLSSAAVQWLLAHRSSSYGPGLMFSDLKGLGRLGPGVVLHSRARGDRVQ